MHFKEFRSKSFEILAKNVGALEKFLISEILFAFMLQRKNLDIRNSQCITFLKNQIFQHEHCITCELVQWWKFLLMKTFDTSTTRCQSIRSFRTELRHLQFPEIILNWKIFHEIFHGNSNHCLWGWSKDVVFWYGHSSNNSILQIRISKFIFHLYQVWDVEKHT